jgi:2-dehydro-3-deoxygluconokinase
VDRRQTFVAPDLRLDVYDRVGGGDGFASGSSMACSRRDRRGLVRLGWAHGALLATFPATRRWRPSSRSVPFAKGDPPRIQR